jgi:proprotein convertase subtilisin/kexin type 5
MPGNPCSNCDTVLFFELDVNTGNCVCQHGYALASDNLCKPCSQFIPNCDACSTTSVCTQCSSGYALADPTQCTYICPHTPTTGCLDCIMPGNPCSNCDTVLFFELDVNTGNCVCQHGYALASDNLCKPCSQFIPNCDACSTTSVCTQCSSGYALADPTQCTYICPHTPTTGCLDCIMPGNPCSNCDTVLFFELDVNTGNCVCQHGYALASDNLCKPCSQFIPNCDACSTTSVCTQCSSGYALADPTQCTYICPHTPTTGCLDCIMPGNPCSNCDTVLFFELDVNTGNCVCQHGYALASDNLCKPCSQFIPNCDACSTTSVCTQCSSGYALADPTQCTYICPHTPTTGCLDCIMPGNPCSNCDTVLFFELDVNTGNCVCQHGYALASDNLCKPCSQFIPNCDACSTTSVCTQCSSGYALADPTQCTYICPHTPTTGCLDCIMPGNPCSNCDTVLFFELDVNTGNCVCQHGYALASDNLCKPCSQFIPNCDACSTTSVCTQCSSGYALADPTQCTYICPHTPTTGCLDCIMPGNPCSNCDTVLFFELDVNTGNCVCQHGYALASDNLCKPCSQFIPNCDACSTTSVCTQCSSGYALADPTQCTYICPHTPTTGCLDCIMPGNPCSNCDTVLFFELDVNTGNCVCQHGYALASDNLCKPCSQFIPNCDACSTTSVCTQCSSGYALADPTQCTYICPHTPTTGCLDCIMPGNPCSNCDTVLFFELDVNTGNCVCQHGYALASDNLCKPCSQFIPNCDACSTTSVCTQCSSGYALADPTQCTYICPHTPTTGCLDCIMPGNPCSNCDTVLFFELDVNTGNCVCQHGYALASDNLCKPCSQFIPNCDACSTTSVCTQCSSGYALADPTQCTYICPHTPTTGCLDCIMPGNPCSNCDTVLFFELDVNTGNCVCQHGYALASDNLCKPCSQFIPNCDACSTTSVCTQCSSGYALADPTQCTYICPHTPTTGCLDCIMPGNPCSNCDTVLFFELDVNTGNCVCQHGYALASDNLCKPCSQFIPNCDACSTTSVCTQCSSGYALADPTQCTYICPHTPTTGCLDCIMPGNPCSNCDTVLFFELDVNTGNCVCQHGYALASDNLCKPCSQFIPNCDACSTTSVCTQCSSGYALADPTQCL